MLKLSRELSLASSRSRDPMGALHWRARNRRAILQRCEDTLQGCAATLTQKLPLYEKLGVEVRSHKTKKCTAGGPATAWNSIPLHPCPKNGAPSKPQSTRYPLVTPQKLRRRKKKKPLTAHSPSAGADVPGSGAGAWPFFFFSPPWGEKANDTGGR